MDTLNIPDMNDKLTVKGIPSELNTHAFLKTVVTSKHQPEDTRTSYIESQKKIKKTVHCSDNIPLSMKPTLLSDCSEMFRSPIGSFTEDGQGPQLVSYSAKA